MSKSAHTEAQIIGAVKQVEAGRKADEVAREMGVSKHTIYAWKQKYGGLEVAEAQELRQLREENARLKRLVADYVAGQRRAEVRDSKKRIQLVGAKAQLLQARADVTAIREAYRMSERQACKRAGMAISSYRYQARSAAQG